MEWISSTVYNFLLPSVSRGLDSPTRDSSWNCLIYLRGITEANSSGPIFWMACFPEHFIFMVSTFNPLPCKDVPAVVEASMEDYIWFLSLYETFISTIFKMLYFSVKGHSSYITEDTRSRTKHYKTYYCQYFVLPFTLENILHVTQDKFSHNPRI